MKNSRLTILSLILILPLFSFGQLLPQPEEIPLSPDVIDQAPLDGVDDCVECKKYFTSGPNKDDSNLIEYHKKQIFGENDKRNSSGTVDR